MLEAMMLERIFQANVIKEIKLLFPDCFVLKNDGSNVPQGFPDILILFNDKWAALEFKQSEDSPRQPNQKYYVDRLSSMSFARFIYPENKEDVLNDLQRALRS